MGTPSLGTTGVQFSLPDGAGDESDAESSYSQLAKINDELYRILIRYDVDRVAASPRVARGPATPRGASNTPLKSLTPSKKSILTAFKSPFAGKSPNKATAGNVSPTATDATGVDEWVAPHSSSSSSTAATATGDVDTTAANCLDAVETATGGDNKSPKGKQGILSSVKKMLTPTKRKTLDVPVPDPKSSRPASPGVVTTTRGHGADSCNGGTTVGTPLAESEIVTPRGTEFSVGTSDQDGRAV